MRELIESVSKSGLKTSLPELRVGQTVKVHQKIAEGDKSRVQIFEGLIIMIKGSGISSVFTVRKMVEGIGVEKSFPLHSPTVVKIEVLRQSRVRRAKLFYMRKRTGKATRLRLSGKSQGEVANDTAIPPTVSVTEPAKETVTEEKPDDIAVQA